MPATISIDLAIRFIPWASGKMEIKDKFYYVLKVLLNLMAAVSNLRQADANMLHSTMFVKK